MEFSSKYLVKYVLLLCLFCNALGHGIQTNMLSKTADKTDRNSFAASPMSQETQATLQNPAFIQQNLESFNRPEGIESLVPTFNRKQQFETSYGRTFGQYGSYKKHTSWNRAVAKDMRRHGVIPKDFETKFPWLVKKLHIPSVHGFGLNGFWNSYALPEVTPNVKGLGPSVSVAVFNVLRIASVDKETHKNPLLHRYSFYRLLQQTTFENIVTEEKIAPAGAISSFATMFSKLSNLKKCSFLSSE